MSRLDTKEKRLAAREAEIQRAAERGARILRHEAESCVSVLDLRGRAAVLTIYDGTACHASVYASYRGAERAEAALQAHLSARRRRLRERADAEGHRRLSGAAQTAAAIRAELARVFPGVRFAVRSSTFSMGDSVDIEWTDGPVTRIVDYIVKKYEYGTFDPMTDCAGVRALDPALGVRGAKYVMTQRSLSPERREAICESCAAMFGEPCDPDTAERQESRLPETWPEEYRELYARQQEEQCAAVAAHEEAERLEAEREEEAERRTVLNLAHSDPTETPADVEQAARVRAVLNVYGNDMDDTARLLLGAMDAGSFDPLDGIRRESALERADAYATVLLAMSPECPTIREFYAFIFADPQTMRDALAAGDAACRRRQEEEQRRADLLASVPSDNAMPCPVCALQEAAPEASDLLLVNPTLAQLAALRPAE